MARKNKGKNKAKKTKTVVVPKKVDSVKQDIDKIVNEKIIGEQQMAKECDSVNLIQ